MESSDKETERYISLDWNGVMADTSDSFDLLDGKGGYEIERTGELLDRLNEDPSVELVINSGHPTENIRRFAEIVDGFTQTDFEPNMVGAHGSELETPESSWYQAGGNPEELYGEVLQRATGEGIPPVVVQPGRSEVVRTLRAGYEGKETRENPSASKIHELTSLPSRLVEGEMLIDKSDIGNFGRELAESEDFYYPSVSLENDGQLVRVRPWKGSSSEWKPVDAHELLEVHDVKEWRNETRNPDYGRDYIHSSWEGDKGYGARRLLKMQEDEGAEYWHIGDSRSDVAAAEKVPNGRFYAIEGTEAHREILNDDRDIQDYTVVGTVQDFLEDAVKELRNQG